MTMALSAYNAKKITNSQAAIALVVGFSGQLKSWWDNFLDNDDRTKILNHTYKKMNDRGVEIDERDGAEVLIHTITLHFLGNLKEEQASAKTILINLRCPTFTDYQWYKDVFITNVLKREDDTQYFWKERFIAGLPKLFGERILNKLCQNFGTNDIPFILLTFGQLFGIVKTEGLNLCNKIKIQSKYGSERAQSRKEMDTFCEAFGLTKIEAPSTARKRIQKKRAQPKFKRPPKQPKPFSQKGAIQTCTKGKTTQQKEEDHCLLQMWQNRS